MLYPLSIAWSIVLENDLDMDPMRTYRAYKERWIIEEAFRMYKDIEDLDETRVHSDYSVMGTQFVNCLSTVLSCRLARHFGTVSELDTVPYGQVLRLLRLGQKAKYAEGGGGGPATCARRGRSCW